MCDYTRARVGGQTAHQSRRILTALRVWVYGMRKAHRAWMVTHVPIATCADRTAWWGGCKDGRTPGARTELDVFSELEGSPASAAAVASASAGTAAPRGEHIERIRR